MSKTFDILNKYKVWYDYAIIKDCQKEVHE